MWLDHDSWRMGFWVWFGLGWLRARPYFVSGVGWRVLCCGVFWLGDWFGRHSGFHADDFQRFWGWFLGGVTLPKDELLRFLPGALTALACFAVPYW